MTGRSECCYLELVVFKRVEFFGNGNRKGEGGSGCCHFKPLPGIRVKPDLIPEVCWVWFVAFGVIHYPLLIIPICLLWEGRCDFFLDFLLELLSCLHNGIGVILKDLPPFV